ncbi:arylesterase [Vibrio rarus]
MLSLIILFFSFNASASNLLILGDSLSAGYQMPIEKAWPTLLREELAQRGHPMTIINGSISGDTTGNGLTRLPSLLQQHKPDYVLIELGANDGLRGFPPKLIKNNLEKLITTSQDNGAKVILMQIQVPPNYGKRYTQAFAQIYPTVSKRENVDLIPFFLTEIITNNDLMMQDGLHPKAKAQPWIAKFVADELTPLL